MSLPSVLVMVVIFSVVFDYLVNTFVALLLASIRAIAPRQKVSVMFDEIHTVEARILGVHFRFFDAVEWVFHILSAIFY